VQAQQQGCSAQLSSGCHGTTRTAAGGHAASHGKASHHRSAWSGVPRAPRQNSRHYSSAMDGSPSRGRAWIRSICRAGVANPGNGRPCLCPLIRPPDSRARGQTPHLLAGVACVAVVKRSTRRVHTIHVFISRPCALPEDARWSLPCHAAARVVWFCARRGSGAGSLVRLRLTDSQSRATSR
jgi:hypothetical protein